MRLVIFLVWTGACEGDLLVQTIPIEQVIDEFSAIMVACRLPLSESMPSKSKGRPFCMASIAKQTVSWLRLRKAIGSVQPVQMSVQVKVFKNCPAALSPQCATRSISMKPGLSSFHSVKVRIGMFFLSRVPGLVVLNPCGELKRTGARQRSIVERLMCRSNSLFFVESVSSSQRSNTLIPSGR